MWIYWIFWYWRIVLNLEIETKRPIEHYLLCSLWSCYQAIRRKCIQDQRWQNNLSEIFQRAGISSGWAPIWRCTRQNAPSRWKINPPRKNSDAKLFQEASPSPSSSSSVALDPRNMMPLDPKQVKLSRHCTFIYLPMGPSWGEKVFILFVFTDSSSKPALPSPHWTPEVYNTKGKKSLIASLIYIVFSFQAGTEETWVYPSQQMFFNALLRKGGNHLKQEYVWFTWNYSSFKWPP